MIWIKKMLFFEIYNYDEFQDAYDYKIWGALWGGLRGFFIGAGISLFPFSVPYLIRFLSFYFQ